MKIGMILDAPFPPDPRVENEALYLLKQSYQVFLFSLDYSNKLPEYEIINGIHVYRYRVSRLTYKLSALAYTTKFYHRILSAYIKDFILKTRIDSLHIHDMAVARAVVEIGKKYNIPTVLDLHENRPEIMKFYPHVNSLMGKIFIKPAIWEKYESRYIRESDKVIVVTKEAREYYQKKLLLPRDKIKIVPNTVRRDFYTHYDTQLEITRKYQKDFMLLYLGETGLRRGLETAIKAVYLLKDKIPTIKLVIVGKSRTDEVLRELISSLHLEKQVEMAGWQTFDCFPSYIKACKIGISPIHQNIHHNTTYANKIFQYLSFGKPIVVSDCLAQANIAEDYHCGLVFKDQDEQDFADKIDKLYRDSELYLTMAKNAVEAIDSHLRWEKQAVELSALYNEIEIKELTPHLHGIRKISASI